MLTFPKDSSSFSWTRHIKNKMVFYHLSGAQILRIFRKPERREEGIAPGTFAGMQTKKLAKSVEQIGTSKTRNEEIWIMYKLNAKKFPALRSKLPRARVTLISAWRYPGRTKPGERPTIPEDALAELEKLS